MNHFDWLRGRRPRGSARHLSRGSAGVERRLRDRLLLGFDRLEDRTMLSISPVVDVSNSNNVGFLGLISDTLYLSTNSSGLLEWSSDGTNFTTNLGGNQTLAPSTAGSTTITVSVGTVDVENLAGGGENLTIQALGAPNGSLGTLMATELNITGNVHTQGGNLSILNMESVDINAAVTISTRQY